jgi:hypothetical protein
MPLKLLLSTLAGGWIGPALIAGAIVGGGVYHFKAVHDARTDGDKAGAARVHALWTKANALAAEAAASAAAAYRATEEQRADALRKELDDAHTRTATAVADAGRAAAAAASLRDAARAAAARCGRPAIHPAAAASSAPVADPGLVLADVLGRMDEAGRAMAAEADRRGIAGAACERIYDSLTTTQKGYAP